MTLRDDLAISIPDFIHDFHSAFSQSHTIFQSYSRFTDHICKYIEKDGQRYSTLKCIWYPTLTTTKCKWHYGLCQLFYQIIPSAIIDLIGPNKPISCMKISRMIANTPTLDNDTKDYTFSSKMIDGIWSR